MLEDLLRPGRLVLERDAHALVYVADDFEALANDGGVELDLGKNSRIRMKVDRRPRATGGARLLQRPGGLASLEGHLPQDAVAFDARDQLRRQGVHDAGANTMQTAGGFVTRVLELSAGVEHRENHFERALLRGGMLVDRDAAPIVRNGDGAA